MTRDDILQMLRGRHRALEEDLRILNYGRHDFGSGEDGLIELVIRATKRQIAILARLIERATGDDP